MSKEFSYYSAYYRVSKAVCECVRNDSEYQKFLEKNMPPKFSDWDRKDEGFTAWQERSWSVQEEAIELYGRECIWLGPEEHQYDYPYCSECLVKIKNFLSDT